MVKVTINDEQYMSLVDSGSDICVIPSSIVQRLGSDSMINVPFRNTIEVNTACGEKRNITAIYNITFQVGDNVCNVDFYEVQNVGKIILGCPFLQIQSIGEFQLTYARRFPMTRMDNR